MRFERRDDQVLAKQLYDFETDYGSYGQEAREDFVDLVMGGDLVRHVVRSVQSAVEQGRPWPTSFPDTATLLAHLETYDFRLACGLAPVSGTEFWAEYERGARDRVLEALPLLLEANFKANLLGGRGHRDTPGRPMRTTGRLQEWLSREVGAGDLITAVKVVFRMAEEGVDGGLPALRHRIAVDVVQRRMGSAKKRLQWMCMEAGGEPLRAIVVREINKSSALGREVKEFDIVAFWPQYVDAHVDQTTSAWLPRDLS